METIRDRVIAVIKNHVQDWYENDVKEEADIIEDLGCDSLDTVEMLMAMEEEFGIDIPDEDAEKCETVKDAINYVEAAMK